MSLYINPNITISGGIYISDSKTQLVTLYEGERCLDDKSYEGKDALHVFGQAFSWSKADIT